MNEKKLVENFTSYINVSAVNIAERNGTVPEIKPKLLKGELVIGFAHNVVMLTPLSERDRGRFGSVFVTNYKLSFVPLETSYNNECGQRNSLLGPFDVPLGCVGAVWLTDGGPQRRRRVDPTADVPAKVKGLQVVCKNMKVLTFSFVNSAVGNGRKIALALIHHAFPKRHDLLFAFDYKEPYYRTLPTELNMFERPSDWKKELERCGCPHWRITCINGTVDAFMFTAGETLIVPSSVLDCNLLESARHFRSGRVPIWVWGRPEGAALLRSGELLPTEQAATAENVLLEQVRRSHPKLTPPHILYLCGAGAGPQGTSGARALPPLPALRASYLKLQDLCTPSRLHTFWVQDSQYYSYLEASRWLRHVATCLAFADEAARKLSDNVSVVLLEGDGVDYSCVVSCLTQLLVDPAARSLCGLQALVQKEWIALGHPFCDRSGYPRPGAGKDDRPRDMPSPSPVFSLFLDCCWQLQRQRPADFQFTQTYLATLRDAQHNQLFTSFLFNCPRERALVGRDFVERPIWDWAEQFSEQDIAWFYNPLYVLTQAQDAPAHTTALAGAAPPLPRLAVSCCVSDMQLWEYYERWLPALDAPHAGLQQAQLFHMQVYTQIQQLKEKLASMSILSRHSNGEEPFTLEPVKRAVVSRFYPFSLERHESTGIEGMQVSLIDASLLLDSQSLLNAPD